MSNRTSIDHCNIDYWDELCGTSLARSIGVTDDSKSSLEKFDFWYFQFYPYLEKYIPFTSINGKRVLEVGLGYGSVAQRLAENGAEYTGLDIALAPVEMVSHRFSITDLPGSAYQGSILQAPFQDSIFDYIVAIGCYHHTGNVEQAIRETYRLLTADGQAIIMLYNAYSYRRWLRFPKATMRYWLLERKGVDELAEFSERERRAYDANQEGKAAPTTEFLSKKRIKKLTDKFRKSLIFKENFDNVLPLGLHFGTRDWYLKTLGPLVGLDLYVRLWK